MTNFNPSDLNLVKRESKKHLYNFNIGLKRFRLFKKYCAENKISMSVVLNRCIDIIIDDWQNSK